MSAESHLHDHRPAAGTLVAACCAFLFPLCATSPLAAQEILAVKAGRLRLGTGKIVENTVVLCEDGRIRKIGADVEVPWNAKVVDASKMFVMAGWVLAHGSGGMDRENESMPVTPYLSVLDSVDPSSTYFEACRRNGISTQQVMPGPGCAIGGRGIVLKPVGRTPEAMAVVERAGMKLSLEPKRGASRGQQVASVTKALSDAIDYRKDFERRKAEFKEDKKNGATTKEKFDEEIDKLKQPLLDLVDGKIKAWIYVPSATDVPAALALVRRFGLDAVFVLGPTCYKAAALLKSVDVPLVLAPDLEVIDKDPVTEKETIVCPARVLRDAGIHFALTSVSSSQRFRSVNPALTLPWWQVATCVRNGIPEDEAIDAFTRIPAKILGLSDRLGEVAEGFDANLQVLRAAPLDPECQVEYLIIEGRVVYDRRKDPRVKALTGRPARGAGKGRGR